MLQLSCVFHILSSYSLCICLPLSLFLLPPFSYPLSFPLSLLLPFSYSLSFPLPVCQALEGIDDEDDDELYDDEDDEDEMDDDEDEDEDGGEGDGKYGSLL